MAEHTVYHPTFPTVTVAGLSSARREAHKKAGWRMTPIPTDTVGDEPAEPKPSGDPAVITTDATGS